MIRKTTLQTIAGTWLLSLAMWPALGAGPFRASCLKVDITPRESVWMMAYGTRRSEGIHDRIFHRIVAMQAGDTRFVLISTDVTGISPVLYRQVLSDLEERTGLGAGQVWWAATHTHSSPVLGSVGMLKVFRPAWIERYGTDPNPEYSRWAVQRLVDGVQRALSDLRPARLGLGQGRSLANINRRPLDLEGTAFFGKNPDGPADRDIGLIRLEHADGSPLGLIVNYAMHGTVMAGKNLTLISGDAPGIVAEYVEEQWGAPVLFINGAAGNLAPIHEHLDFTSARQAAANLKALLHFRVLLGRPILEANRRISTAEQVDLALGGATIPTPLRADLPWGDELSEFVQPDPAGGQLIQLPVSFLQINREALIWSMPVELFTEIAQAVRERSSFRYTFFFGYTNGLFGYLPTAEAHRQGGYEPTTSPFTPRAESDVVQAVVPRLQR